MAMAVGGGLVAMTQVDPAALAEAGTTAANAKASAALLAVEPATGWPFFIGIGFAYFIMAFLLLGAIFLGVCAQAGTVRGLPMLSLPLTLLPAAIVRPSSATATAPGSTPATVPHSTPFTP